ncbi:hypothetical protein M409DRAFT_29572 [Zasmidium cellare ATCC 36951]|uniref:Stress-response A/B barrel domain-containing protein n=1 Tax=Zasmidium cellare ATCC 36951 TaxID=1080233 RepID=A0A6A6BYU5_ZASCE|nr:uncharacterized protein M409DRAFT_29572 [Zasmidium cellare ATCC 36951]KAF2159961.1 hypothetical protein M409DRAFT_29572 [Zasmidium cellare ATCC 36951]
MPVYHIVLFRLKESYEKFDLDSWQTQVEGLVGVIPGLRYVDVGAPLPATAFRAKGFNVSLVAVLDGPDDAPVYAEHPAHVKITEDLRPKLFDEVVVCDMEFKDRS